MYNFIISHTTQDGINDILITLTHLVSRTFMWIKDLEELRAVPGMTDFLSSKEFNKEADIEQWTEVGRERGTDREGSNQKRATEP